MSTNSNFEFANTNIKTFDPTSGKTLPESIPEMDLTGATITKTANKNIINATMEELEILSRVRPALSASGLTLAEILKAFQSRVSFNLDNLAPNDIILAEELNNEAIRAKQVSSEIRSFFKFFIDEEKVFVFSEEIWEAVSDCIDTPPANYFITNHGIIEISSDDGMNITSETSPEELFKYFKAFLLKQKGYEIDYDTQDILEKFVWVDIFLSKYKYTNSKFSKRKNFFKNPFKKAKA